MQLGKHLLRKIQVMLGTVDRHGVTRDDPLRAHPRRRPDEAGASLVEFALVLPLFMMLILGMFTGGLAYSRKLSIAQAAREGARYGATLPAPGTDAWLTQVAGLVIDSSDGELEPLRPGQAVCVAYVTPTSARRREQVGTAFSFSNAPCLPADGRTEARVQVVGSRTSELEAVVFSRTLTLSSHAVARHESP